MPRRTTTAEKVAAGNPGKRKLPEPIEPKLLAKCPGPAKRMQGRARELWKSLAPEVHRLGMLTVLDVPAFESLCDTIAQEELMRQVVRDEGYAESARDGDKRSPAAMQWSSLAHQAKTLMGKFGMTPKDRQGMEAPAREDATEEFDARQAWLARSSGKR